MPHRHRTDDLRVREILELAPPSHLLREFALSPTAENTVVDARQSVHNVLHGSDDRLVVVVGPCSIHDYASAVDFANLIRTAMDEFTRDLILVMRVYFEKPRTTVGWKGFINDPRLDGSYQINEGLRLARKLLLEINELGVPTGTEYLDMITPQYLADLVAWGAIGARTTESQVHRELASGLSCPVGFKNGSDGNVKIAVDAMKAAAAPHHFLSVTKGGISAIVATRGNEDCHVILRGGLQPNYDSASVNETSRTLGASGLAPRIMIDLSHANSQKNHERQVAVSKDVAGQVAGGDTRIFGVMIESHLKAGRQDLGGELEYGMSITDACLDWGVTHDILLTLSKAVRDRRKKHLDVN
ncbi:MAG: 3-deoxy-7-phosphoheptulonate synthase [Armatimonadetes bacterium]|nr:3-deoxy-7-phosphoheptulonate synthase [Armatimonadota bacterium]